MFQQILVSSSTFINKKPIVPQLIFDENTRILALISGTLLVLLAIGLVFKSLTKI